MVGRAEAHNISVLLMKYFCEMIQTSSDWGKRERGDLIEIEWENGGGRWRSTAGSWNQQINTPTIPKRRRFSGRNRHHRLSWRRQIHCKSYSPVSMPFFFFFNFFNGDSSCYHVASIVWNYMNQHFSLNCAVSDMNYMYWFVIYFWNTVIVKWWNGVYLKLFALNMIKNGWMGGGFNLLKSLTGALC